MCTIETNKRSICSGDNIEVTVSSQTESVRLSPDLLLSVSRPSESHH